MADLDVIKENIEVEKPVLESTADKVLKGEYLIPDTHPDVHKVLSVEAKPIITNKEVQQDRGLIEVQVNYNVIYLAKEEDGLGTDYVSYEDKFSNFVDIVGAEHKMLCDANCELEHINVNIINERKISIESYFRTKCYISKNENIEFVKDIEGTGDLQSKKKPDTLEKTMSTNQVVMPLKTQIKVATDKPQIGKIIKMNLMLHKKDIKASEDKLNFSCFCKVDFVYRAADSKDLVNVDDDVFLSTEEPVIGLSSDMMANANFEIMNCEYKILQDDLGESRIIDVNAEVKATAKVSKTENIEVLEDAYSPTKNLEVKKETHKMIKTVGQNSNETIVKDNIYLDESDPDPVQIVSTNANIAALENKVSDNKVNVEGVVKVEVIYKCSDEEKHLAKITGEIPFNTSIDIPDALEGMESMVKAFIEGLQANIEAHTIAIKAIVFTQAKVTDNVEKEYIKEIEEKEGEKPEKKASIIIYVIQEGDKLWDLAKKYNTTVEDIMSLNSMESEEELKPGEKIIIPGRAMM
ncbi:protein of unknown function [Clostridium cavendishii DSM 21758]|uniref:LysM domain-containing protein n=1 Tax=Clostridium cavendishii DSM 21758 TaxID=1121302 RepID=A0A1M6U6C6_9CLOT|nr:SPOCS domain-containing protein [Clostridium cavendishii]SHK64802.1 protein of unknown function [Clostridium cavendishii DSM 21758]